MSGPINCASLSFNPGPKVEIDGHPFWLFFTDLGHIALLETALRARRGDRTAGELLDKFKVVIHDADGRQFYPPVPETEPEVYDPNDPAMPRW